MRINGEWHLCDDGVVRPIVRGEILTGTGLWQATEFLVDTGADRTVFSAPVLTVLGLQPVVSSHRLSGVGGMADAVFGSYILMPPSNTHAIREADPQEEPIL